MVSCPPTKLRRAHLGRIDRSVLGMGEERVGEGRGRHLTDMRSLILTSVGYNARCSYFHLCTHTQLFFIVHTLNRKKIQFNQKYLNTP